MTLTMLHSHNKTENAISNLLLCVMKALQRFSRKDREVMVAHTLMEEEEGERRRRTGGRRDEDEEGRRLVGAVLRGGRRFVVILTAVVL